MPSLVAPVHDAARTTKGAGEIVHRDVGTDQCAGVEAAGRTQPEPRPWEDMHYDDDGIEISATDLKRRLDRGDPVTLIDVREPWEWELANLESYGARLMPMMTIPERLDEFDASREYVLYCRSGSRSMRALQFMNAQGLRNVRNLQGGLLAWSNEVDPTFPQY